MNIEYKLDGTGWAECIITVGDQTCTTTASYLSDALKSFVQATISILKGAHVEKFRFDEEPGEYRWLLNTISPNELNITILDFNELWGDKPDTEGKEIFKTTVCTQEFSIALKKAMDHLIQEHGLSGYKEKWSEHEFPIKEYKELCSHLNSPSII